MIDPYQRRTGFNRPQPLQPPDADAPAVLAEAFQLNHEGDWDVTMEYQPGARANVVMPDGGLTGDNLTDVQRWLASWARRRR